MASAILGRGRNGMWLGRLALFGLHTWNQDSLFFRAEKFLSAAPTIAALP